MGRTERDCAATDRPNVSTTTRGSRIPSFFLYGEAPAVDVERTLHIETIASRSAGYRWQIAPHVHRSLHQLLFARRGRGIAIAEDSVVRFRPPALVVVPAGAVHGFEFEPGTDGFVVSISDDLLAEAVRREPGIDALFGGPSVLECTAETVRATRLELSLALFAADFGRSGARALSLEGWLAVILAKGLDLAEGRVDSKESGAQRERALVARFRALIDRHPEKGTSVTEYAAALHVSESTLRSACLSVTDQSPIQLVHARVMLEAKRQLLYTNRNVSEIAYELGFDDPAYFTRFFSRRTGLSPTAFRLRGRG